MANLPIFAKGDYNKIQPAIETGVLSYPSFVVTNDDDNQYRLAFVDSDLSINLIEGTKSSASSSTDIDTSEIEESLAATQEDVLNLQQTISSLEETITALQESVSTLNSSIEDNNETVSTLASSVAESSDAIAALQETVAALVAASEEEDKIEFIELDDEEDDGSTTTVEVNGVTYSFSSAYDSDETAAAVASLEEAVNDTESDSEFDAAVADDEESTLGTYLGCYEVSAETGVLTLASPVVVDDPEAYTAIVLHYNETTGEWEQVDDVQIVDGYVYAVFTSLSPVAVCLLKKKYAATVTIDDVVTKYETIAEAVEYALANLASMPVVALTWNKRITETIGPLYSTSTGNMTFDLGGYTVYADIENDYAISITGDASTTSLVLQNGTVIANEGCAGAVYVKNVYCTINDVNMESTGGTATLLIDGVKAYPTNCSIAAEDTVAVQVQATDVAGLTSVLKECTITSTGKAAIVAANVNDNAFLVSISDCAVTATGIALDNESVSGKLYITGDSCTVTGSPAVYVSSNSTITNAFYTGSTTVSTVNGAIETDNTTETNGITIKYGIFYNCEILDAWIEDYYVATLNEDGSYICEQDKIAECTTADGVVTYKNALSSAAMTAAGTGGTVKLLKDYSSSGLGVSTGATIDLNGHTFTTTAGIYMSKAVDLVVKNGTVVNSKDLDGVSVIKATMGTVTLKDVTLIANEDADTIGVVVGNTSKDYSAEVTISGDTVITAPTGVFVQNKSDNTNIPNVTIENAVVNSTKYAITGNGSYDGTVITVNGGTFNGDAAAMYIPQDGTVTINGGAFNGGETGLQFCDGTTVINDATVAVTGTDETMADKTGDGNIPDGAALSVINRSGYSASYPTLKVNGGKFTGQYGVRAYSWASNTYSDWDEAGNYIDIYGGYFSTPVDQTYCGENITASEAADEETGLYTVA